MHRDAFSNRGNFRLSISEKASGFIIAMWVVWKGESVFISKQEIIMIHQRLARKRVSCIRFYFIKAIYRSANILRFNNVYAAYAEEIISFLACDGFVMNKIDFP